MVGGRLRGCRASRGLTLAEVADQTGISVSTLSRLESGGRRATLELLLPLARAYGVTLDELVAAPSTGDPRVHLRPVERPGMTMMALTNRPGGLRAYKLIIKPSAQRSARPQTHEGYEWIYVLEGTLRLLLGDQDLRLGPGEVVEFDTRIPHWFGCVGPRAVQVLSLFGPQGERMHTRTPTTRR
jgi:transcriptional regulator with XRE-family HTH domain